MATIVTRAGKGSPLTNTEVDSNFTNLNNDKLESGSTASSLTITSADINGGTVDGITSLTQTNVAADATDVELKYSGSTKLATTSTGIDVTGTVTADGLTVDGTSNIAYRRDAATFTGIELANYNNGAGSFSGVSFGTNAGGTQQWYVARENQTTAALQFCPATVGTPSLSLSYNGDISFYEDTGTTAKFFWDASAESLGIGTSSPSTLFHIDAASDGRVARFGSGTSDTGGMYVTHNSGSTRSFELSADNILILDADRSNGRASSRLQFNVDGSERMRIDSTGIIYVNGDGTGGRISGDGTGGLVLQDGNGRQSFKILSPASGSTQAMTLDASGNLLVGKTSANGNVAGPELRPAGQIIATRDGGITAFFNRLTSDGTVVQFEKDGITVGTIGTAGNQSYIHGAGTDVGLYWGSNNVYPYRSTGLDDASIDLGQSGKRFKNLYLSGGVYLGGTGAANYLDDYEEGTWTPAMEGSGNTYSSRSGFYTKIGNMVYVRGQIALSGGSPDPVISGLPFTSSGVPEWISMGFWHSGGITFAAGKTYISGYVNHSTTTAKIEAAGSGSASAGVTVASNANMYFAFYYSAA